MKQPSTNVLPFRQRRRFSDFYSRLSDEAAVNLFWLWAKEVIDMPLGAIAEAYIAYESDEALTIAIAQVLIKENEFLEDCRTLKK